ncbi:NAD(P)/FAD-dependent oxidoreductase [Yinghuangia soli]|uniref:FAD-dependent oxidoreductase n=1 Tax=Yinghuangia soli TaxID=2908204 RepID=A0AA41Q9V3_9ACTN|nr:FAD-dependent oxidoreductase [Yinghuangia soli]MCF2533932.1 FAD-dependent oxidoreductase [Yinghuangia soli]
MRRRHALGARPRVAVVGSGVSGLTAAYLLQRAYDVVLFESDDRLGGHAHTHDVPARSGGTVPVDTGFLVHNERTYPHLIRLFRELGVRTQDTEMSMSVRCEGCGLEYAGARRAGGLFAQRANCVNPRYLRMLGEVVRFHRAARALLAAPGGDRGGEPVTLGRFLDDGGYSDYFVDHFAMPLVSAVWSTGTQDSRRYPAAYLFAFLDNHGMLGVSGSPVWKTVVGGSRTYVELAVKSLSAVHVATPVRAVRRGPDGVEVRDDADRPYRFDAVVLAAHADDSLRLLADPTPQEQAVLGAFRYARNDACLHTDAALLPRAPAARASWNYLKTACRDGTDRDRVLVSYDLDRLMRLDESTGYITTLGATDRPRPDSVVARMVYRHPVFTPESVAAQRDLPGLADGRTAFAGAYHGWGFHEDGCASGVRAAASLGVVW